MKKVSLLFFSMIFLIGTDTFLISPLLPILTAAYKIPTEISGWMVSSYALGYAISALFVGPVSDGLDRKKVMIFGLIVFSLSTFLCGLSSTFWTMVLFRLLAGIGATFVGSQVWAAIPQLVARQDIVKSMGYATAGLSISQVVGLPVGSYLAALSWRAPFFVTAGCSIILLCIISAFLPPIPAARYMEQRPSILRVYSGLFQTPRAVNYMLAYFIFQTGNFEAFSFIGLWYSSSFSLHVAAVGTAMIVLGIGNAIGSLFGSSLIRKLGEARSLFLSFCAYIILYSILPFSHSLVAAEAVLFLIFLTGGYVFPVFMSTMQSLTATARGTVSALANAAMYAGTTIGGIIGGLLFSRFSGFTGVSFFTVTAYIVSLLIYAGSGIFSKHHKHPGDKNNAFDKVK
ncbi:MFS transporter [Sporolactobacillus pectinivorans]|uniref:MFS transporter n=1 Tax=Sporolactobacillus pectinivorans TaxID=1591408 RepID=UPI000C2669F7|nr:MFS transporter [Sporolactobacillus pectinivorans]